jgi:bifunctional non-homologous end joining protein LigD
MSLEKYKDKRNFNNTSEPAAETNGPEGIYPGNEGGIDEHASTVGGQASKDGGAKHTANTSENPAGTADDNAIAAGGQIGMAGGHMGIAGNQTGIAVGHADTAKDQSVTDDMPVFVIQKHYASHLHFDFRLELGGVLKSWAIPKGPSINPKDKKLAVMVEDHPLEYKDFEGVIPEGNYGAGKVYQWDSGTYHALGAANRKESEESLQDGLQKGHLTFILNGNILKGEFALIRLRKASPKDWLLIKKNDEFAGERDISKLESADEVADKDPGKKKRLKILEKSGLSPALLKQPGSEESGFALPHYDPMLATLVDKPFDRKGWLFEIKWDGYRAIAEINNDDVMLISRNQASFNTRFPAILDTLKKMQITAVLDGEIVVVDSAGRPDFQLLQQYLKNRKGVLVYYIFDILYFEGYELTGLPLISRKNLLKEVFNDFAGSSKSTGNIRISDFIEEDGIAFFNAAKNNSLEGILAKKSSGKYIPGSRSKEWLKIKIRMRQEVVIGGFTEPKGSRAKIGSLVTGVYKDGEFIFTGQVGTGLDENEIDRLYGLIETLKTNDCPFKTMPATNTKAVWVDPVFVIEVEFAEWTIENVMRQPVYIGLREDKDASGVTLEKPEKIVLNNKPNGNIIKNEDKRIISPKKNTKTNQKVILTHPDKVFWPEEKYTKKDLFDYYSNIADFILPYIIDRPQSLNRCPDGIEGECFYQKDIEYKLPEWFQTVKIHSESNNKDIDYLVCNGIDSLLYIVNLGCIDIHPWLSQTSSLEQPDFAVLDLDPLDVDFPDILKIACEAKKVLDEVGIEGFFKTSGSKGIHIFLPLGAKYTYGQSLDFIKIIAAVLNIRNPKITSLERSPDKRHNKIYLDCYQNRKGQTVAAPYCIRPRPGAPVSTPLHWEELDQNIHPEDFNMKNIFHRLESAGDIWKNIFKKNIDMEKCIKKLSGFDELKNYKTIA